MPTEITIPISLAVDLFLRLDSTLQASIVLGIIGVVIMAAGIMKWPSFEKGLLVFNIGAIFVILAVALGIFGNIILNFLPLSFKVV